MAMKSNKYFYTYHRIPRKIDTSLPGIKSIRLKKGENIMDKKMYL